MGNQSWQSERTSSRSSGQRKRSCTSPRTHNGTVTGDVVTVTAGVATGVVVVAGPLATVPLVEQFLAAVSSDVAYGARCLTSGSPTSPATAPPGPQSSISGRITGRYRLKDTTIAPRLAWPHLAASPRHLCVVVALVHGRRRRRRRRRSRTPRGYSCHRSPRVLAIPRNPRCRASRGDTRSLFLVPPPAPLARALRDTCRSATRTRRLPWTLANVTYVVSQQGRSSRRRGSARKLRSVRREPEK